MMADPADPADPAGPVAMMAVAAAAMTIMAVNPVVMAIVRQPFLDMPVALCLPLECLI